MSMVNDKLIVLTNDDGVDSPGIAAAASVLSDLGQVIVAAPSCQQSGAGRSMKSVFGNVDNNIQEVNKNIDGVSWSFYAIDGSPAQAVQKGLLVVSDRLPDLVVSGINFGENLGADLTISGTVGAAWEAASFGVTAIAVSLETDLSNHTAHSSDIDFTAAMYFTKFFAEKLLYMDSINDVDLLNINIPSDANVDTNWSITRQSRQQYFVATNLDNPKLVQYKKSDNCQNSEPESDIYSIVNNRIVSVTPISIDATSRISLNDLENKIHQQ